MAVSQMRPVTEPPPIMSVQAIRDRIKHHAPKIRLQTAAMNKRGERMRSLNPFTGLGQVTGDGWLLLRLNCSVSHPDVSPPLRKLFPPVYFRRANGRLLIPPPLGLFIEHKPGQVSVTCECALFSR